MFSAEVFFELFEAYQSIEEWYLSEETDEEKALNGFVVFRDKE